jgi:hypothetical protein
MDSDIERLIALVREQLTVIRQQDERIKALEQINQGLRDGLDQYAKRVLRFEEALLEIAKPDSGWQAECATAALREDAEVDDGEQPEPAAP